MLVLLGFAWNYWQIILLFFFATEVKELKEESKNLTMDFGVFRGLFWLWGFIFTFYGILVF